MIRAIFFDLDDTLVDAMDCHIEANKKAFESFDVSYQEIENNIKDVDFLGLRVSEVLEIMRDVSGKSNNQLPLNKLIKKREKIFLSLVKQNAKLLPGAKKAIIDSSKNFEVVAVVSSGTREFVTLSLKRFGLLKHIKFIVSAEDVRKGKPNPECYIKAFKRLPKNLQIQKEECLVVEDSVNGIKAAKKAGLKTLLVPSKYNLKKTKADITISSLNEFTPELLKTTNYHGSRPAVFSLD
jgi:beta-phosphoglucomutase